MQVTTSKSVALCIPCRPVQMWRLPESDLLEASPSSAAVVRRFPAKSTGMLAGSVMAETRSIPDIRARDRGPFGHISILGDEAANLAFELIYALGESGKMGLDILSDLFIERFCQTHFSFAA